MTLSGRASLPQMKYWISLLTEPGASGGVLLAGEGGRARPLPGAKPLDPSGPRAMRTPFGAPGACSCMQPPPWSGKLVGLMLRLALLSPSLLALMFGDWTSKALSDLSVHRLLCKM